MRYSKLFTAGILLITLICLNDFQKTISDRLAAVDEKESVLSAAIAAITPKKDQAPCRSEPLAPACPSVSAPFESLIGQTFTFFLRRI